MHKTKAANFGRMLFKAQSVNTSRSWSKGKKLGGNRKRFAPSSFLRGILLSLSLFTATCYLSPRGRDVRWGERERKEKILEGGNSLA